MKVWVFEVPPPGEEFTTVTEAISALAISAALIAAVRDEEETNVVEREAPFQFTVELATKFVPLTVRVNDEPPADVEPGLKEVVVGTGLAAGTSVNVHPLPAVATA